MMLSEETLETLLTELEAAGLRVDRSALPDRDDYLEGQFADYEFSILWSLIDANEKRGLQYFGELDDDPEPDTYRQLVEKLLGLTGGEVAYESLSSTFDADTRIETVRLHMNGAEHEWSVNLGSYLDNSIPIALAKLIGEAGPGRLLVFDVGLEDTLFFYLPTDAYRALETHLEMV